MQPHELMFACDILLMVKKNVIFPGSEKGHCNFIFGQENLKNLTKIRNVILFVRIIQESQW